MVAAQVLGTCARKGVGVRVPPSAPASPGFSEIELEIRSTVLLCCRSDTNSDTNSGRQHATDSLTTTPGLAVCSGRSPRRT